MRQLGGRGRSVTALEPRGTWHRTFGAREPPPSPGNRRVIGHSRALHRIFELARDALGPQHWWPAQSPFEVCVGAILTQNTAWTNVERAIANLKSHDCLSAETIHRMPANDLARLIQPAGYFNIKAKRLKSFVDFLIRDLDGDIVRIRHLEPAAARRTLLAVHGIGPETADSMLLYAAGIPIFVCDAYTRRILHRHGVCAHDAEYHVMQELFHRAMPRRDAVTFNEFHALIVAIGKDFCRPMNPRCALCPLGPLLTPAQRRRIRTFSKPPEKMAQMRKVLARSTPRSSLDSQSAPR